MLTSDADRREWAVKTIVAVLGCMTLTLVGWSQVARQQHAPTGEMPHLSEAEGLADTGVVTRRVWAGGDVSVFGGPSPDGRYLSFVDWETGDLAVRDLRTGENRRLTNKGTWWESSAMALFSVFSADGEHIAYAWSEEAGQGDERWDLRTIGRDGSAPRVVYRNAAVPYLQPVDWTPDGSAILTLFHRQDGTNQIALVSAADGSVRPLKTLDWRAPLEMALSPDGRYVAYDFPSGDQSEQHDIFVLATDGSQEEVVARHAGNDFVLAWLPDGILFASDRSGKLAAWHVPIEAGSAAGRPQMVQPELWRLFPIGLARQSGMYFYATSPSVRQLYLAALDLESGKLAAEPKGVPGPQVNLRTINAYAWSPDGRYLAYWAQHGPSVDQVNVSPQVIAILSLESGLTREFPAAVRYIWTLKWSPDGRELLLAASDPKGRSGLFRVDVQTGDVRPLLRASEHVSGADWFPDGQAVFYHVADEHGRSVIRRDVDAGTEDTLYHATPPERLAPRTVLAPDGKWMALQVFVQGAYRDIRVIPASGGEPRTLVRFAAGGDGPGPMTWTPDSRSVLYSVRGSDPESPLWEVPLDGGAPRKLDVTLQSPGSVRFHPDGRRIAFVAGKWKSEIWAMHGFEGLSRKEAP
jgi:Tol biopolymer transport system component